MKGEKIMQKTLDIKEIKEQIEEIEKDWKEGKIFDIMCLEEKRFVAMIHNNIADNISSISCFDGYNDTHILLNINKQIHIRVSSITIEYKEGEK